MYCLYINIFLSHDILVQPISKHVNSSVVLYSSLYFQVIEREKEREKERDLPFTCHINMCFPFKSIYSIIML